MSMLYLTGKDANILRRSTVTCSPAASSIAPLANLYDDDPSTPFIFGSNAANQYIRADINVLDNPTFDAGITGWTTSGTVAHTTTAGEWRTASGGMKITNGYAYQLRTVPAGESRKLSAWAKIISGPGYADIRIQNTATGNWWNGTSWQAAQTSAASTASGSFTELATIYTVESFDVVGADHCTLLIGLFAWSASNVAVFDDVYDVPGVSFVSIHGHNIRGSWAAGPTTAQVIRYSDDAWATSSDLTYFEHRRPAFYKTFSIAYHRWWDVLWYGTNFDIMYLGEMVLGQCKTSATSPQWGLSKARTFPGVRTTAPGRKTFTLNYSIDPTQDITLSFSARSSTDDKELCESLWLRSGQGRYPTVIVPIDTEAGVFYGRILEPVTTTRPFSGVYDTSLTLLGDPFPTVGA